MYSHNMLAVFKNFKTIHDIDFHGCGGLDNKLPMHIFFELFYTFQESSHNSGIENFFNRRKTKREEYRVFI